MEDLIDKDLLKAKYRDLFPNDPNMRINHNVGQIHRFVNELKVGDLVISLFMDSCLLVGIIESELYFKSDSTSPYPWRKKVKWFKEKIDRHPLSVPLQNTLRSSLNCFRVFFNSSILDNDISQISFFKEFLGDRPQWLMRRK